VIGMSNRFVRVQCFLLREKIYATANTFELITVNL